MSDLPTLRYVFFHQEPAPDSLAADSSSGVFLEGFWRDTFTDTVSHLLNSAAGDEIVPEVVTGDPLDEMLRLLCEMPHIVRQGFEGQKPSPDPEPADQFQQLIEDSNLAYNFGFALRIGIKEAHELYQVEEVMRRMFSVAQSINDPQLNPDELHP
jgi:hypothetical protein